MKKEQKSIHWINLGIVAIVMLLMLTPKTFGIPELWRPWTTVISVLLIIVFCSGVFEA